jgi:urea transport system substrate-binding protein
MKRRWAFQIAAFIVVGVSLAIIYLYLWDRRAEPPIQLGILFAKTGLLADLEAPLVEAVLLAVDEINSQGGVLGRKILPIVVDTASDDARAAELVRQLITENGVSGIVGCVTSSCRKAVRPIVEELNGALFYPLFYEGLEASPNILYVGGAPNQQILPGVQWAHRFLGDRMYIVGSDYVFPRVAGEIVKDRLRDFGIEVLGEEYFKLGHADFDAVAARIKASEPSVVLSMIVGGSNKWFFRALHEAGIDLNATPVMSFANLLGTKMSLKNRELVSGAYLVANYFSQVNNARNRAFREAFLARTGGRVTPTDPVASAYTATRLWALGVTYSGSEAAPDVLAALRNIVVAAPEGTIRVDPENGHLWKRARIGRVGSSGVEIVWESSLLVPPVPYPRSRTKEAWDELLTTLHETWGGAWAPSTRENQK